MSKLFSFNTYSQNISISIDDVTLKEAIHKIEENSSYRFFYNNNLIDITKKVSLKVTNQKMSSVLVDLLKETNIDFRIYKDHIVLFPRNRKTSNKEIKELLKSINKEKSENRKKHNISFQNLIQGIVTGSDGMPLPGVNVVKKGTSTGTQTDFDGNYRIEAKSGDILVFSYLGFETQEITIGTSSSINITLKDDVSSLEEVIVTGYAVQRKSRVTGAAVTIKPEVFQGNPRSVVQESLQGNVPGLQVASFTGQPGVNPTVRIRGVGSFNNSDNIDEAGPLYVLDGLQVSAATIATINPGDIENISILKDAAATSIYGSRAANGVIVITTSTGKSGATVIRYSTQTGFSTPTVASRFKPLSTAEHLELLQEGAINAGRVNTDEEALQFVINNANFNPDVDTDWYEEIIRTGNYRQHDLSISGGSEKTTFYLSGGYFKQEGVVESTDFERMNARLRLNHRLNDRIKLDANISYNKDIQNERPLGGNDENPIRSLYRVRSDQSVFNEDGSFNLSFNDEHNPIAEGRTEVYRNTRHRILGGITLDYELFKGLTFQATTNMNTTILDNFIRLPRNFSDSADVLGIGEQDTDILFNYVARGLVKYFINFDTDHTLTTFAGYEVNKTRNKRTDVVVNNILDVFPDLEPGAEKIEAGTRRQIQGVNSAFINGEYSYADKYLLSGSLRRDGSSKFGENNRYGVFWSVGVGWNIAKEGFMSNQSLFNDLKFRGSFGINGNDNIPDNRNRTIFNGDIYTNNPAFVLTQLGNPDIKWEENEILDIGLDYALFNSRIQGSVDWYKRNTKDLLQDVEIPTVNGDLEILRNVGEVENTGFEFELTSRNIVSNTGGFEWDTNINFSTNRNEVVKLVNDNAPIVEGTSIITVGEDINTFYLPLYAGVDPSNGEALWYLDGSRTDVTNNYGQAEQAIAGNATPDFYGSLKNTFRYKGFSLAFQFYTAWGGSIYDTWGRFTNSDGSRASSTTGNVNRGTYERRWQQPGDVTDVPAFVFGNTQTGSSSMASSRFLYDGSYIRLREAEIAYTFSPNVIQNIWLSSLRIYVKGNNLWTYIHDDRLERDPEAGFSGRLNQNIPISKTLFFGLDVSF
ncbi:TonB-dependent receptor [Aquimarina sp. U1-2]|uniref:TonB-dependent receptor n=1 Tax=Aquimarina sp. U1-2 TaxID=2823141 RepID=UPI001AEC9000|nr:TonB-dependent receptor [Aquimarina sp. U1-2]MBP2833548.1 TonB-dependent receptor [Aquimarina sp. U1-2]